MKRVVAFSGSPASSQAVSALVGQGAEVVTVTPDVGQTDALDAIRARALEAGAARAHVVDARESFVRSCVLPAMQTAAPIDVAALAAPLIARTLDEVAAIEGGVAVPQPLDDAPVNLLMRPSAAPAHAPEAEARLDVTLDNGVPIAVNGVPMTPVELIESLSLIAGQHGIGHGDPVPAPAAVILRAVYAHAADRSATVRLTLHQGRYRVLPQVEPAVVTQ